MVEADAQINLRLRRSYVRPADGYSDRGKRLVGIPSALCLRRVISLSGNKESPARRSRGIHYFDGAGIVFNFVSVCLIFPLKYLCV